MKTKNRSTRVFSLMLVLLMIFSLTGCKTSAGAGSDGYDKFSKLKIGMTKDEVTAILGEPSRVDKAYYYYNIKVNKKDLEITVWIDSTSGKVTNLYGEFMSGEYRTEFADKKTDLSKASDLDSGDIDTYDACKEAFKTPGYLIGIDEDGVTEYLWVNSDDGYMTVTFDDDGNVKMYNGLC